MNVWLLNDPFFLPVALLGVGLISFIKIRSDLQRCGTWNQLSWWDRSYQPAIMSAHRASFPASRLRKIFYGSIFLFFVLILAQVLLGSLTR
jgi:hypothetical protein